MPNRTQASRLRALPPSHATRRRGLVLAASLALSALWSWPAHAKPAPTPQPAGCICDYVDTPQPTFFTATYGLVDGIKPRSEFQRDASHEPNHIGRTSARHEGVWLGIGRFTGAG